MSYYDEELPAGFQEADFEQASFEAEGRRLARLRAKGYCTHSSVIAPSATGEVFYNEQIDLHPDEVRCMDGCGGTFKAADWPNVPPVLNDAARARYAQRIQDAVIDRVAGR